jgi:hypothetical protein
LNLDRPQIYLRKKTGKIRIVAKRHFDFNGLTLVSGI